MRCIVVIHHWNPNARPRQDVRTALMTVSNVIRQATTGIIVFVGTSAITINEST